MSRYESVADHTWRLCLMILLFEDKLSEKFDISKTLKMALIHDLQEIISGDDSPMGDDGTGKTTYAYDENLSNIRSMYN